MQAVLACLLKRCPLMGRGHGVMPWAEYAIAMVENGIASVELRRVMVDVNKVKEAAMASRMPEPTDWLSNWERMNTME